MMTTDQASDLPPSAASSVALVGLLRVGAFFLFFAFVVLALALAFAQGKAPSASLPVFEKGARADHVEALERRLSVLEATVHALKGASWSEPQEGGASSAALQARVEALSTALQAQDAHVQKTLMESRARVQGGLEIVMAYLAFDKAAASGAAFEAQRQGLIQALGGQEAALTALAALEPMAATGVPTPAQLLEWWDRLAPRARSAWRQTMATTWYERLLFALQDVVSIRLEGREEMDKAAQALALLAHAVQEGRLRDAAAAAQALPAEPRAILAPWSAALETRNRFDTALQALTAALVGRDSGAEAQP